MSHLLRFPRACHRLKKSDFDEVFLDELRQQEDDLKLERYCEEGGWPDPESIELKVDNINGDEDEVVVRVSCRFDEVITTSCADIHFTPSGFGNFDVVLAANDELAHVEYILAFDPD
jgi:hypothetical protein